MNDIKNSSIVVMVFAKAPRAGKVKTRIGKKIGMKNAEKIYRTLLSNLLKRLTDDRQLSVQLWCWPDTKHSFFKYCARHYRVSLHTQRGSDLGAKMSNACKDSCRNYGYAIIAGSDLPEIDSKVCKRAYEALKLMDVVLAPTFDGGYGLIAVNNPNNRLFNNMRWSEQTVLSYTLNRARRQQLKVKCLDLIGDIDTYEDFQGLKRQSKR